MLNSHHPLPAMAEGYEWVVDSPVGALGLQIRNQQLIGLAINASQTNKMSLHDAFTNSIAAQLQSYFGNPHHHFTLAIYISGTPFQKRLWQALCAIPPGKPITYGQLAAQLQSSPRAVGQACRRNPIPIIIPCHRVTAKSHLGGYAGATKGTDIQIKKWLLQHESE